MAYCSTTDSNEETSAPKRRSSKRDAADRAVKSIAKQVAKGDESLESGDERTLPALLKPRPKPRPANPVDAPVNRALPGSSEQREKKAAGSKEVLEAGGVGRIHNPKATSYFLQLKSMAASTLPDGWRKESFNPKAVSNLRLWSCFKSLQSFMCSFAY